MTIPEFLDVDDVIALHDELLEEHGGQAGIRDRGLLESAVATPMATFDGVFLHEDLFASSRRLCTSKGVCHLWRASTLGQI